jgi:hypothetical protein
VATFIDQVRCGGCDAELTLEVGSVVVQRYRRQPWLQHFWVKCDACAAQKLYWPTPRQLRLATQLICATNVADDAPADVTAAYARSNRMPMVSGNPAADIRNRELVFLLWMLAATCGPNQAGWPARSYLPPHWAN